MNRIPVKLATLALIGAIGVTGCGSSTSGTSSSGATSTSAAPKAAAAKVGDTVDLADLSAQFGAAAKSAKTSHATGVMTDGSTLEGDIDYAAGDFSLVMKIDAEQSVTMVKKGATFYMGGLPEMPTGKKWIKIEAGADDPFSQMMAPMLEQMGDVTNPTMMATLKGVNAKVISVEGDLTTYESSLTAAQVKEISDEAISKMIPSGSPTPTPSSSTTPGPMTMTQTIDGKGLITKTVTKTTEGGKDSTMTMTYTKWGEAITIATPSAAEVTTFTDLMKE